MTQNCLITCDKDMDFELPFPLSPCERTLIYNKETSSKTLEKIASCHPASFSREDRIALVKHPNATEKVFDEVARRLPSTAEALEYIANHPKTSMYTLMHLRKSNVDSVRKTARKAIKNLFNFPTTNPPKEMANSEIVNRHLSEAPSKVQDPETKSFILLRIASTFIQALTREEKIALAKHPNADGDVFDAMVQNQNVGVPVEALYHIIHHPKTYVSTLEKLLSNPFEPIRNCAKRVLDEDTRLPETFKKADSDKPDYTLLDKKAMEQFVKVLEFGANKYGRDNWRKCEDPKRYVSAMFRHLMALNDGETHDPETGIRHEAHIMCSAMFLLGLEDTSNN